MAGIIVFAVYQQIPVLANTSRNQLRGAVYQFIVYRVLLTCWTHMAQSVTLFLFLYNIIKAPNRVQLQQLDTFIKVQKIILKLSTNTDIVYVTRGKTIFPISIKLRDSKKTNYDKQIIAFPSHNLYEFNKGKLIS